jgi:acetyl esterase/lipase
MRDLEMPLPSGAMLISPWVDLMHSFPSVVGETGGDYIPNWGFHHKPSLAWPPPTIEELEKLRSHSQLQTNLSGINKLAAETEYAAVGYKHVEGQNGEEKEKTRAMETLKVEIDGKMIEMKEQIQMIAPNEILNNPLLSPVTQASLGGLCPILIVFLSVTC